MLSDKDNHMFKSVFRKTKEMFKPGDRVVISNESFLHSGLREQEAEVIGIVFDGGLTLVKVIAKDHNVPNCPADFKWEIVPEFLTKM